MSDPTVLAHTNEDPSYPGYVNITKTDSGVRITVRGDPILRAGGSFVCGYSPRDKGQPGRCTPGDERCNNYCNHDPSKPMADAPMPGDQVFEGPTAQLVISNAAWELVLKQLR